MRILGTVLWAAVAGALLGCTPPGVEVALPRTGDTVEMTSTREETVLVVRSETGIGRASITPSGSLWPRRLVLRFHLQDLEGINLDNGKWKLDSFLGSDMAVPYAPADREEAARHDGTDPTVDLPVTRDGMVIQVVVPSLFLDDGHPELRIQWVDFYRM